MTQNVRRTARRLLGATVGLAAAAAAVLVGPLAGQAAAAPTAEVLATGSVTKGNTTYPNAVITYDPALDATDAGSNPGLEVWPDAAAANAGTGRLSRSNDNNGQWDYAPAGAFYTGSTFVVYGTRTGSHGPQGRTWTYTGGSFLSQGSAVVDCGSDLGDGKTEFGPFAIAKGNAVSPAAVVVYDQVEDDGDAGSTPGLRTFTDATRATQLQRAGDNNGQWDYRVDCAYGFNNTVYIVGARSANGGATFVPRVWITSGGSFLTQSPGL